MKETIDFEKILKSTITENDYKHLGMDYRNAILSAMREAVNQAVEKEREWISIEDKRPNENETVWLYNSKSNSIWLGCYVYMNNEGWFWAMSNGSIYCNENKIITEAEFDDDYEVTHWKSLPDLPILSVKERVK